MKRKEKKRTGRKMGYVMMSVLAIAGLFTACTEKEEKKHTECDIESAWVEGAEYEQYFFQASQMRYEEIATNVQEIVFTVRSMENLPEMPVYFTVSEGATISPASGTLQDFTNGAVVYTVTSEDGKWQRTYNVSFREPIHTETNYTYSFENVDSVASTNSNNTLYHVFYELDAQGKRDDVWASGNEGVAMINSGWRPEQFPTHSVSEGYRGKGVCLNTQDAGTMGRMFGKPIAAGSLFLGHFNVGMVFTNALKATEMGVAVDRQPVKVRGYYKYQPGAEFTNANMEVIIDRVDEASIYAVFYRNQDESGKSVVLYGDDVNTSPQIVSRARVATLPATDEWTLFEMEFEGGEADPEILSAQGYNMVIVFSSSKDGDLFEGAIGSTLYIDEVEVIYAE